ncbi:YlbE-like family protein [Virgibacillus senegalensis]|uniref:YlbE-like family protein n=1 Tax=Virgibacillus senegalensis TaxID=1499679 RepID=UPI00069FD657|nr:YlbE-like family protein [Virgibacillus senegalensis]
MQPVIYQQLNNRPDLKHFIRMNPEWYRKLTRNPDELKEMEKAAKVFYGKTIPQRMERLSDQMQMVTMLIQLAGAMKD